MSIALATAVLVGLLTFAVGPWGRGGDATPSLEAAVEDFSLDFIASAPFTYDHTTGGGVFDPHDWQERRCRRVARRGDFQCGEVVSYLVQIVVDDGATGSQTIRLTNTFLADTTVQPGAGHSAILGVHINAPAMVTGGDDGPNTTDTGSVGPINSTIANVNMFTSPAGTALWPAGEPDAGAVVGVTYDVTGLEGGDHVIVRIDTRLSCGAGTSPTGNLHADLTDAEVVAPADQVGKISAGNQTVPFKQFGSLPVSTATATAHGDGDQHADQHRDAYPRPTPPPTRPTNTATNTPTNTATNTPDGNGHQYADQHGDKHADGNGHQHADQHRHQHADGNGHEHAHEYGDDYADRDVYLDADADVHRHTNRNRDEHRHRHDAHTRPRPRRTRRPRPHEGRSNTATATATNTATATATIRPPRPLRIRRPPRLRAKASSSCSRRRPRGPRRLRLRPSCRRHRRPARRWCSPSRCRPDRCHAAEHGQRAGPPDVRDLDRPCEPGDARRTWVDRPRPAPQTLELPPAQPGQHH